MFHSIVQYALAYAWPAFGVIASLALFHLKREIRSLAAMHQRRMEELALTPNQAPAQLAEPVFVPPAPRSGLNITKRVQAMRMLRRNEDISHIAAALGVTRREIELLIRVQKRSAGVVIPAAN